MPTSLSPSRVEKFTSCPLAFRFASIEKLPERPSIHTTRGSLVHRALELAYARPAAERTRDAFLASPRRRPPRVPRPARARRPPPRRRAAGHAGRRVPRPRRALPDDGGPDRGSTRSASSCASPPRSARSRCAGSSTASTCATTASWSSSTTRPAGRPSINWEQKSLAGVHFYSFLCEEVLGRRPAAIRLMYLQHRRDHRGHAVGAVGALHHHRAPRPCGRRSSGRARPRTSGRGRSRCATSCSFQQWCPAFGGDPDLAHIEAPALLAPSLVTT